jgi:hypothetical protein
MQSSRAGSVIINAVIWQEECLDEVARRITLASARTIQHSWRYYKEGFSIFFHYKKKGKVGVIDLHHTQTPYLGEQLLS